MLKYLFTATYADGSIFKQATDDASELDSKRSSFFDALERGKKSKMVRFELNGDGKQFAVDLRDGHFEVNGTPFYMHEEEWFANFELVFFRRHTHTFKITPTATPEEKDHTIEFRLGWQTNDGKSNHQRVMQVD